MEELAFGYDFWNKGRRCGGGNDIFCIFVWHIPGHPGEDGRSRVHAFGFNLI